MVHAPEASSPVEGAPAAAGAEFAITLKGWRSQLRWAMTQREEDPARVWLEVISIDERSKRALESATQPEQRAELVKFRARLEESIASLTEELGDEKVAPLYSWLDLVRQRRRLVANIDSARAAVAQARALRLPDARPKVPKTEEQAAAELTKAQGELLQWQTAIPPAPPPEVVAVWDAEGGDARIARMSRDAMAVGRRGDEARRVLECAKGRIPGRHPWRASRAERISIPVAGGATLVLGLLAAMSDPGASSGAGLSALAALSVVLLAALLAFSIFARRQERAELAAAIDWVWHARMYGERTSHAELEAGWLRALVDAQRRLRAFDARAASGGQLRDFEQDRPDLAEIVHEVARDTEPLSS
jgi:hypothetical protein